jgi:hypothetical protein
VISALHSTELFSSKVEQISGALVVVSPLSRMDAVRRPSLEYGREPVSTFVPLFARKQIDQLPERAREVTEYRNSATGLSLNHIQGCPLDCACLVRHTYGVWDQRQPSRHVRDGV